MHNHSLSINVFRNVGTILGKEREKEEKEEKEGFY
jgi:hypothetical protein